MSVVWVAANDVSGIQKLTSPACGKDDTTGTDQRARDAERRRQRWLRHCYNAGAVLYRAVRGRTSEGECLVLCLPSTMSIGPLQDQA